MASEEPPDTPESTPPEPPAQPPASGLTWMGVEVLAVVVALILGLVGALNIQSPKPRRSNVVASEPLPSPTQTATPSPSPSPSPTDSPSPTATASASPAPAGPPASPLGPPPAGAPIPAVSTVVYLNGPATLQVYSAPDPARTLRSLPGHNSIDQPAAFLVLDSQPGWYHVLIPVQPNGSTGWVKASDVQVTTTNQYLRVTVSQFRLDRYQDGKWTGGVRVAVGKPSTPTPTGLFYIVASQAVPSAPYNPGIFALSGFAPQPLPGFLGATLGLHGWTDPGVIGTQASNGCVRVATVDMNPLLHSLLLGTPVDIVA